MLATTFKGIYCWFSLLTESLACSAFSFSFCLMLSDTLGCELSELKAIAICSLIMRRIINCIYSGGISFAFYNAASSLSFHLLGRFSFKSFINSIS
ncbi:hypothetical protein BX667DRAFT_438711 [Coemansia mojavensis]|nr:hypothetical protein BX667DRAFT_438711 [Coemansia mojavensis]